MYYVTNIQFTFLSLFFNLLNSVKLIIVQYFPVDFSKIFNIKCN